MIKALVALLLIATCSVAQNKPSPGVKPPQTEPTYEQTQKWIVAKISEAGHQIGDNYYFAVAFTPAVPYNHGFLMIPTVESSVNVPTFSDNFDTGFLNKSKWEMSDRTDPNCFNGGSDVTFSPSNIDMSKGLLRMTLTQPTDRTSSGAEIRSIQTFGYGTYVAVMRQSSTAPTEDAVGKVVSGSTSAFFSFIDHSRTEIDTEFTGNKRHDIYFINRDPARTCSDVSAANLASGFHTYQMVWSASQIQWSIDGIVVATHTTNIPSAPAYIMFNFWGTNRPDWGGLATVGVERFFYIKSVSFTPEVKLSPEQLTSKCP